MNKLKTFFHALYNTMANPYYYNDILKAKHSFTIKYLILYYVILSIASSLVFAYRSLPQVESTGVDIITELTDAYPENLTLTIDSGHLTVAGVEEPFSVEMPEALDGVFGQHLDNLITLDSTQNTTTTKPLFALTKDRIIVRRFDNSIQSFLYENYFEEPINLDQETYSSNMEELKNDFLQILPYLPVVIGFGTFFLGIPTTLISNLVNAFIAFLTFMILRKNITYGKSYQVSLHLATFALTADFIRNLFYPEIMPESFFSLAFGGALIITAFSVKGRKKLGKLSKV